MESNSIDILESLRKCDQELFLDPEKFDRLALFLSFQYLRTPGMLSTAVAEISAGKEVDFDVEASMGLMRLVFSTSVSRGLVLQRESLRATFLHAGALGFVTADQPAVNVYNSASSGDPPEAFHLYYPLSPDVSVLLEFHHSQPGVSSRNASDTEVLMYNDQVFRHSFRQLYAASESDFPPRGTE